MALLDRVRRRVELGRARGRDLIEHGRIRFGWFDHLLRTFQRYQVRRGNLLAGSVTYYAFLSFFPLVALAFAVFGYVVAFRPDALDTLVRAINEQLPGLADRLR